MTILCQQCGDPVSMRTDREADRRRTTDGWAHTKCLHPEAQFFRDIFGPPQKSFERHATDEQAADLGHRITLEHNEAGFQWRCACGMVDSAPDRSNKSAQRDHARGHLRFVIANA